MRPEREPPEIRIDDALGVCGVRQDTRLLAEMAAAAAGGRAPCRALDLGTGSGYVAIYLALRGADVDAVDISPRALALAGRNAALNGVALHLYRSNLFDAVAGPYDVIACNPPMRADETEFSRLLTSALRRVGPVANALLRLTQPLLERRRLGFVAEIARRGREHLAPGGRLLLVISPAEEAALPQLAPGLERVVSRPVPGIPGLNVACFAWPAGRGSDAVG